MVFLWSSYGFPMAFPGFSHAELPQRHPIVGRQHPRNPRPASRGCGSLQQALRGGVEGMIRLLLENGNPLVVCYSSLLKVAGNLLHSY